MVPENLNTQQIVTYWGFQSLLSKPLLEQQVGFHATGTETGIQVLFLAAPGAALTILKFNKNLIKAGINYFWYLC